MPWIQMPELARSGKKGYEGRQASGRREGKGKAWRTIGFLFPHDSSENWRPYREWEICRDFYGASFDF